MVLDFDDSSGGQAACSFLTEGRERGSLLNKGAVKEWGGERGAGQATLSGATDSVWLQERGRVMPAVHEPDKWREVAMDGEETGSAFLLKRRTARADPFIGEETGGGM